MVDIHAYVVMHMACSNYYADREAKLLITLLIHPVYPIKKLIAM